MKNRNIKALPIVDHGDTDAIFVDDVAAVIERGAVTHVILALVQAAADNEPARHYRRAMVRLIILTDRRSGHVPAEGWLARIILKVLP